MKAANFGIDRADGKVIMKTIVGKAFILFRKSFSNSENVRLDDYDLTLFLLFMTFCALSLFLSLSLSLSLSLCFGSVYCKHYEFRSDCSLSSLICVRSFCLRYNIRLECICMYAANDDNLG